MPGDILNFLSKTDTVMQPVPLETASFATADRPKTRVCATWGEA